MLYAVKWEIDIEAESPREAAEEALMIQLDAESTALVFFFRLCHGRPVLAGMLHPGPLTL